MGKHDQQIDLFFTDHPHNLFDRIGYKMKDLEFLIVRAGEGTAN